MGHVWEPVLYKLAEHRMKNAKTHTIEDCPILYVGPA